MLVLVVRMYILSERKRGEPDPDAVPRVATYWYLLRPEMCTGRHKSPHSHEVSNLHILCRVLLYISLVLSLILFLSFLLSSCPLFLLQHPFLPFYARCIVFLWRSLWIFCFSCLRRHRIILRQTKDSLASSWNVAEIRTNKQINVKWRNAYLEECDSTFFLFLLQMNVCRNRNFVRSLKITNIRIFNPKKLDDRRKKEFKDNERGHRLP